MRGLSLVLVLVLASMLAGCSDPPEADRVTPSAPVEANVSPTGDAFQETQTEQLVDGENAELRIRLTSHAADETSTRVVTQVTNKRADDVLLNYAILRTVAGEFYFELNARIPAGAERTVTGEESSGDLDDRRAAWTELSFYYTVAVGTPEASDAAATLDLRGRGLPS